MKKIFIPVLALVILASCDSKKENSRTSIAVKVSGITENNSSPFPATASGKN